MESFPSSGIMITDVRVANFRALKNVEVSLGELTVLIGANNTGKTSFLDALYAAIGAGRKTLGQDDVRLENGEALPPKERVVTVDVKIRPADPDGNLVDVFPEGSFWTNLWGGGIKQDMEHDYNDFVGLRTMLVWSLAKGDYVVERRFLNEWRPFVNWLGTPVGDERVYAAQIEPIALHYIDAKRDLEDDLRRQGSFWRRMTEDLGLSEEEVAAVETVLSSLNQDIVSKSEILRHLKENLSDIQSVVAAEGAAIDISPVAMKLRDLSKGVDITFSTAGVQSFPLARHGMGTRSLASLLVFRAFASWRRRQSAEAREHIHSLLALEEPESHLHPQAQRSIFSQVKSIPGQRIVSTHSPYFAGQARLADLRLFIRMGGDSTVSRLDLSKLKDDDVRKLRHSVVKTRGDLLFSRAVVFFEGETEEQALPVFAEAFWGASIHELGFSLVRVGGAGSYFPFIWLAENLNIPWYIFSDGETQPVSRLNKALEKVGKKTLAACSNVVVLPDGNNYESQLVAEGYLSEIEIALDRTYGTKGMLDDYIEKHNGKPAKGGDLRNYKCSGGRERAAKDLLGESKTRMAEPIAATLASIGDERRRFPLYIRKLFEMLSANHGPMAGGENFL